MSERTTRTTHSEEYKLTEETYSGPLPNAPLVTFDLNLNNLQDYLNKVSCLVNKNTLHIQKMFEELSTKISFPDGFEVFESIALSIPKELGGRKPRTQTYKDGMTAAQDGFQGVCDKLKDMSEFKKDTEKKLEKIEKDLNQRLSLEKFENEKKKLDEKIGKKLGKKNFSKKIASLEERLKQAEDNFNYKLGELDKKCSEVEVNTLWKIRDCENLLKSRVNEKFVWDALMTLEQKLQKELDARNSGVFKDYAARFSIIEKDLQRVENENSIKIIESKRAISDLEKL